MCEWLEVWTQIFIKACICYFLTNFYLSPNDSPSETVEDVFYFIEKALFVLKIFNQIFVFPSSPHFLPVSHCFRGWSKINLKVYDVINCLNKNLITHFVWYLEKEKSYDIETLSIDRVLNKKHFYGKIIQKMYVHQKLVLDPFFILVDNPKQPLDAIFF